MTKFERDVTHEKHHSHHLHIPHPHLPHLHHSHSSTPAPHHHDNNRHNNTEYLVIPEHSGFALGNTVNEHSPVVVVEGPHHANASHNDAEIYLVKGGTHPKLVLETHPHVKITDASIVDCAIVTPIGARPWSSKSVRLENTTVDQLNIQDAATVHVHGSKITHSLVVSNAHTIEIVESGIQDLIVHFQAGVVGRKKIVIRNSSFKNLLIFGHGLEHTLEIELDNAGINHLSSNFRRLHAWRSYIATLVTKKSGPTDLEESVVGHLQLLSSRL